MTWEAPSYLQAGTYPARLDRLIQSRMARKTEIVWEGLEVTEATPSANFTIDMAIGGCVVQGDDIANQGMYFCEKIAAENVAVPASPGTGTRTDSVIVQVLDATAGQPGDVVQTQVIEGTTIPPSALLIAEIARSAGEPAILQSAITDLRPLAYGYVFGQVSSSLPSGRSVAGTLWIRTVP